MPAKNALCVRKLIALLIHIGRSQGHYRWGNEPSSTGRVADSKPTSKRAEPNDHLKTANSPLALMWQDRHGQQAPTLFTCPRRHRRAPARLAVQSQVLCHAASPDLEGQQKQTQRIAGGKIQAAYGGVIAVPEVIEPSKGRNVILTLYRRGTRGYLRMYGVQHVLYRVE
jgi:hypothetical protein